MRSFRVFSAETLARVIRAGDQKRFGLPTVGYQSLVAAISDRAMSGKVDLGAYQHQDIKGKRCVCYENFDAHLVLRAMTQVLRRNNRIATKSRERIVNGVIETLLDSTPMYALRLDIKSFYETIPTAALINALLSDTSLSSATRKYLAAFFDEHCKAGVGIPRGVGLSALLAEMALGEFDRQIREIDGIYRYFRFADDILIFSHFQISGLIERISSYLPPTMSLNVKKTNSFALSNMIKKTAVVVDFEYLGYLFSMSNACGTENSRKIYVSISERKIKKMKSRVILATIAFLKDKNFWLYQARLRFVTSNFNIRRSGISLLGGNSKVKSGIFYNYRKCGIYEVKRANKEVSFETGDQKDLKALDGFLFHIIRGTNSNLGKSLSTVLTAAQKARLQKFSFLAGFNQRMMIRMRPDDFNHVKAVWKNV